MRCYRVKNKLGKNEKNLINKIMNKKNIQRKK